MTLKSAGDFLLDLAERLALPCAPDMVRSTLDLANGGQMGERRPDGRRASRLTRSGLPFEVSVSGGRGTLTPAIRYVTETATQETIFASRVAAQLTAIEALVPRLPDAGRMRAAVLRTFIETAYPDSARAPRRHAPTWTGIVHHAAAPHHLTRLKAYARAATPSELERLCEAFPAFAGLASVPDEQLIAPSFAALEVDAEGTITHKLYLRIRRDIAAPMKLVRHFGEPAWEILSELSCAGFEPDRLYQHNFFACRARVSGAPTFTLHLTADRYEFDDLVAGLAHRHHGTTRAVAALTGAAEASGAAFHCSALGLGFSPERGIDKLNVYGVPSWTAGRSPT
ncbi:hypothetical protein [Nocardia sp. X0981]